jgi:hypothetical protein
VPRFIPTRHQAHAAVEHDKQEIKNGWKLKLSSYTPRRRLEVRRYSSYSFSTSALHGVSGQCHAPAALYPRVKDPRYPLYRRLGGPQSRSGHRGWRLPLPGIEPQSHGRPARSKTLYWLRYPAHIRNGYVWQIPLTSVSRPDLSLTQPPIFSLIRHTEGILWTSD